MSSENVLKKLLRPKSEQDLLAKYLESEKPPEKANKRPGRPKVAEKSKARNFTLCLAPQYLEFLDKMVVKDKKIQGRGRKIRFIIDRFVEHERRSLEQIKVLKNSLKEVQKVLQEFKGRVKKGEKLILSTREKNLIHQSVDQVHILLKILNYSPKSLYRILPREEWAILSFALDWRNNREVRL